MANEPESPPTPDEQPTSESPGRKAFLLRLSPEVYAALRGWAGQEMRSLNGHIEYLLRQALEERKRAGRSK